jgi:hypothetical protein
VSGGVDLDGRLIHLSFGGALGAKMSQHGDRRDQKIKQSELHDRLLTGFADKLFRLPRFLPLDG